MTSSFTRRTLTVVATLVLLGLIVSAQSLVPEDTLATEPLAYSGEPEEPVDARQFTIAVDKVRFAETVIDDEGGFASPEPVEANGVWVVAAVELTSTTAPLSSVDAELAMEDGYVYSANGWLSNALGEGTGPTLAPGIPVTGAFVFEVPEDRVQNPTLRVNARESPDPRLSARADIDLGLSGAELDEGLAQPKERISVPAPTEKS